MNRLPLAASLVVMAALSAQGTHAWADPIISLNAPVSVTATDPNAGTGYNNNTSGNLQNITNGTILPDATSYGSSAATSQAVEWNGSGYVFQITLSGLFNVSGILVDADDNDTYYVDYHNATTQQWDPLYTASIVSEGFGFRTRPTIGSDSPFELPSPVVTDAVEIFGGPSLDGLTFGTETGVGGYGVAQVELFGTPYVPSVPEPASVTLLGVGLVGLFRLRRQRACRAP